MDRPHLSPLALARIRELKDKHGIEATPDDVVWLHECAKAIEHPAGSTDLHFIGLPIRAGNVLLWPWTIGAGVWWTRCGFRWFHKDEAVLVLAWVLAHARDAETFLRASDIASTRAMVQEWRVGVGCTMEELSDAILRIVEQDEAGNPEPYGVKPKDDGLEENDWLGFVGAICREIGSTPEYWTWQTSRMGAVAMVRKLAAMAKAKGEAPDPSDPAVIAVHNENAAFWEIVKAHKQVKP